METNDDNYADSELPSLSSRERSLWHEVLSPKVQCCHDVDMENKELNYLRNRSYLNSTCLSQLPPEVLLNDGCYDFNNVSPSKLYSRLSSRRLAMKTDESYPIVIEKPQECDSIDVNSKTFFLRWLYSKLNSFKRPARSKSENDLLKFPGMPDCESITVISSEEDFDTSLNDEDMFKLEL
mmetsp:Transcript_35578/g.36273  ORF Transcript_35578/g.36273 Transcript_35578/m.36273 type:complete len:180 (+) Transcript_35578:91-630(+)